MMPQQLAYLGAGCAEWVNFARDSGFLFRTKAEEGEEQGTFRFGFSKRQTRSGLRNSEGKFVPYVKLAHSTQPGTLRWVLGISFIAMGAWILVPDKMDDEEASLTRFGVFGTTLVAFFLAEMGDKTQIATVALAAKYHAYFQVVAGTTLGMLLANVPAVVLGDRLAGRMPVKLVHRIAAALFALLGVATLLGAGKSFGL
jgi:putative Ca2+/H+ antiporter (TMEM165/GDT1 family)